MIATILECPDDSGHVLVSRLLAKKATHFQIGADAQLDPAKQFELIAIAISDDAGCLIPWPAGGRRRPGPLMIQLLEKGGREANQFAVRCAAAPAAQHGIEQKALESSVERGVEEHSFVMIGFAAEPSDDPLGRFLEPRGGLRSPRKTERK